MIAVDQLAFGAGFPLGIAQRHSAPDPTCEDIGIKSAALHKGYEVRPWAGRPRQ